LTEKNCNQVYTSQALSFDPIPFGNRYGQNGVTYLEAGDLARLLGMFYGG